MNGPLVTVVVPAYNAEAYIAEALESVRCQTYRDLQVIVVDDGSTDGTAEVARVFLSDSRFDCIHQENLGVSAAQNAGIKAAGGELLAIFGSDDIWHPGKIERQVEMAREHPEAGLFFTNAMLFDESGDIRPYYPDCYRFPDQDLLAQLLVENPLCAGTVMARTRLLREHGAFDGKLQVAEDYDLWIRLALAGVITVGTMDVLHRQRLRPDSLTAARQTLILRQTLGFYRRTLALLPDQKHRRILRRSIRANQSRLMIRLAQEEMERGRVRRAGLMFLAAWLPKTGRRWLLGAALSCLVAGKWSRPECRQLAGWTDP